RTTIRPSVSSSATSASTITSGDTEGKGWPTPAPPGAGGESGDGSGLRHNEWTLIAPLLRHDQWRSGRSLHGPLRARALSLLPMLLRMPLRPAFPEGW